MFKPNIKKYPVECDNCGEIFPVSIKIEAASSKQSSTIDIRCTECDTLLTLEVKGTTTFDTTNLRGYKKNKQ